MARYCSGLMEPKKGSAVSGQTRWKRISAESATPTNAAASDRKKYCRPMTLWSRLKMRLSRPGAVLRSVLDRSLIALRLPAAVAIVGNHLPRRRAIPRAYGNGQAHKAPRRRFRNLRASLLGNGTPHSTPERHPALIATLGQRSCGSHLARGV